MLRLGSSPCKNRGDKIVAAVLPLISAGMVELVDSEDLGSSAERRVGSSPTTRTKKKDTLQACLSF